MFESPFFYIFNDRDLSFTWNYVSNDPSNIKTPNDREKEELENKFNAY